MISMCKPNPTANHDKEHIQQSINKENIGTETSGLGTLVALAKQGTQQNF
jgi:hypothetical protein